VQGFRSYERLLKHAKQKQVLQKEIGSQGLVAKYQIPTAETGKISTQILLNSAFGAHYFACSKSQNNKNHKQSHISTRLRVIFVYVPNFACRHHVIEEKPKENCQHSSAKKNS